MSEPTQEELLKLWKVCRTFVDRQNIECGEAIYQTDRVIENAYEFIERICKVVGYKGKKKR